MSGDLTGRKPKDTYKDLLQISNNNEGVDATLRAIEDGSGEDSCLDLSTTNVRVRGDFEVTGEVTMENLVLPTATDSVAGVVKIGSGVTITDGVISVAAGGATDAELRDRTTHTGAQAISTVTGLQDALDAKSGTAHTHSDATTGVSGFMSDEDKTKLDGIASAATANASDAQLRDRDTHTGTQAISTVTDLQDALDGKAAAVHVHDLATGSDPGFMSAADKNKLDGLGEGGDYTLPIADDTTLGGVKEGTNISIDGSGFISAVIPIATDTTVGGFIVGTGFTLEEDGTLNLSSTYELPVATDSVLGGVKEGDNITIDVDGTISATAAPYTLPVATDAVLGGVMEGAGVTIDGSGVLTVDIATAGQRGAIRIGSGLSIDAGTGVVTADAANYTLPVATSTLGGVKTGGANITIAGDGTISAASGTSLTNVIDVCLAPYLVELGTGKSTSVRRANLNAINLALSDAKSQKRAVYLPPGTIEIASNADAEDAQHIIHDNGNNNNAVYVFGMRSMIIQTTNHKSIWEMRGRGGHLSGVTLQHSTAQSGWAGTTTTQYGQVESITVTNGGSGYATAPTVTITPDTGEWYAADGVTATASVSGGVVTGVTITNRGAKWTKPPIIGFTGGGGTGATATSALYAQDTPGSLVMNGTVMCNVSHVKIEFPWIGVFAPNIFDPFSNMLHSVHISMPNYAGVWWANGTGNAFSNIYITNEGSVQRTVYGWYMQNQGQGVVNQLNCEWLRCDQAIRMSTCRGFVFNGVNLEGNQPVAVSNSIASLVSLNADSEISMHGVTMSSTNIDPATSSATKFHFISADFGCTMDITGLRISHLVGKDVGTQTVALLGPKTTSASSNSNVAVRIRNCNLVKGAGEQHFIDVLSAITPDASHGNKNVGLLEYNGLFDQGGHAVDLASSSITIYPEVHSTCVQFASPLASAIDVTLSNRIDANYTSGTFTSPLIPRGGRMRVVRHPTATGSFNLNIKNHNGTTLTSLTVASSSAELLFDGTNWRVQSKATF